MLMRRHSGVLRRAVCDGGQGSRSAFIVREPHAQIEMCYKYYKYLKIIQLGAEMHVHFLFPGAAPTHFLAIPFSLPSSLSVAHWLLHRPELLLCQPAECLYPGVPGCPSAVGLDPSALLLSPRAILHSSTTVTYGCLE